MTKTFKTTKTLVKKLLKTVDAGLVKGLGEPVPGKMCVEAAVCYALGLPHSDDPGCVDDKVRALKINLNDCNWSSNAARAAGMRRLAVAQLGTKDTLDPKEFCKRVEEMTIRTIVPLALRAIRPMTKKIEALAVRCEKEGTVKAARAAYDAALAARNASNAAHAADYAAHAALAARAALNAARAAGNDIPLAVFAEGVVQILISMNTDGSKFLYLTE